MEKNYDSMVRFKIKVLLTEMDYKLFIWKIMKEFVKYTDPDLSEHLTTDIALNGGINYWNNEGSIHGLRINGEFICHCKMYYFDEKNPEYNKRVILFRDHFNLNALKIVFLISDAFEEFLTINNIPYERINYYRK